MALPQKKRFAFAAELKWWGHERGTGRRHRLRGGISGVALRATTSPKRPTGLPDDIAFEVVDGDDAFEAVDDDAFEAYPTKELCGNNGVSDFEWLDRVKFPTARKSLFHYWSQNKSKDIFQLGIQRHISVFSDQETIQ